MTQILIVEDEKTVRESLRRSLDQHGFTVHEAHTVQQAKDQYDLDGLDLIISNLRLPDQPGTDLIAMTPTPVLVMTGFANLRTTIDAMQIGAINYIARPPNPDELLNAIRLILDNNYKAQNLARATPRECEQPVSGMVGSSAQMRELFRCIRKVAQTSSPVLIQGESGTGKELVARALHEGSARHEANLVSLNCAAIPEDLIESELFGHEKGAFAGATSIRTGLVEEANNGTLFLDEIGELPMEAQARLLRVVQEHEIRKVGSVQSCKVDIRLVAATSKDLNQLVSQGRFREDLFYRINVMSLQIPPLRVRGSDILELANRKLAQCCQRLEVPGKLFSANAIQAITTYSWPGNVRELENAIERAVTLSEDKEIPMELLGLDVELVRIETLSQNPLAVADSSGAHQQEVDTPSSDMSLEEYFRQFVLEHQNHLNETELAKKLGISRKCLWERRQRFNIPRKKKSA